jgi:hypothetical protein
MTRIAAPFSSFHVCHCSVHTRPLFWNMNTRVWDIVVPHSHRQDGILVFLRPPELVMLWRASPATASRLAYWGINRMGPFMRCRFLLSQPRRYRVLSLMSKPALIRMCHAVCGRHQMICLHCGRGLVEPAIGRMIRAGFEWSWRERSRVLNDTMRNLYELRVVRRTDAEMVGEWSDTGLAYVAHALVVCPTAFAPLLYPIP